MHLLRLRRDGLPDRNLFRLLGRVLLEPRGIPSPRRLVRRRLRRDGMFRQGVAEGRRRFVAIRNVLLQRVRRPHRAQAVHLLWLRGRSLADRRLRSVFGRLLFAPRAVPPSSAPVRHLRQAHLLWQAVAERRPVALGRALLLGCVRRPGAGREVRAQRLPARCRAALQSVRRSARLPRVCAEPRRRVGSGRFLVLLERMCSPIGAAAVVRASGAR